MMLESTCLIVFVTVFSIRAAGVALVPTKSKHSGQGGSIARCADAYANGLDQLRLGLGNHIRTHPRRTVMTSQRRIIFAASPGTTGTSSLAAALIQMGLITAHCQDLKPNSYDFWLNTIIFKASIPQEQQCFENLRNFDYTSLPEHIDAVTDTPVDFSFLDLYLSFPNAMWLLPTRPSYEWANARRTCLICKVHRGLVPPCEMDTREFSDANKMAHMFDLHNEFVRCVVPSKRLFEFDIFTNGTIGLMHKLGMFLKVQNPPSVSDEYPKVEVEQLKFIQQPWLLNVNTNP